MSFRVTARTILHLGSELISSDGIAFYELIKNALDARAHTVRVDVVQRLNFDAYDSLLRELGERRDPAEWITARSNPRAKSWHEMRMKALRNIDKDAPKADELKNEITSVRTKEDFTSVIRAANYIDVDDDGDGMSVETLKNAYLTIGTSNRARQPREGGRSQVV